MTPKEIIEKLRLTFNELVNNADVPAVETTVPEAVMPMIHKLKDGTEVEITEMGVGGVVTIQGVPAPVGDHELEDGTVITVGDNGAITAIVPVATEPAMVEDMSAKFSAFELSTNEKFASYEAKFADYEAKLKKATKVIEGLLNLTQTLAEAPTGTPDPIVKTTNNFKEEKGNSYDILFN
jgi:hypothetical protein